MLTCAFSVTVGHTNFEDLYSKKKKESSGIIGLSVITTMSIQYSLHVV